MRARLLTFAALLLACGSCCAALAASDRSLPPRFVPEAVSRRAAREDIARHLAHMPLPATARIVDPRSPKAPPRLRGRYPIIASWASHLLWGTRFVFVAAPIDDAVSWFAHHPPPGSKLTYRTNGPRRTPGPPWYRCLWFEWEPGRPAIDERILTACATRSHGGTAIRVDAQAVWLEGRSRWERIPGGSRRLEITVTRPHGRDRKATVKDPRLIEHVVALVNSLPVTQHSSYTCPHGIEGNSPPHPGIRLVFRPRRGGQPIARLSQSLPVESGCRPLHISIRGRSERDLDEGWLVVRALDEEIARAEAAPRRSDPQSE